MPTSRLRRQVTKTPEVARALDAAARQWSHEPRFKLLLRLVQAASIALEQERAKAAKGREAAIEDQRQVRRPIHGGLPVQAPSGLV